METHSIATHRETPFDSSLGFMTSCNEITVGGGVEYTISSGFAKELVQG
jgi:hypothetical protein